MRLKMKRKLKVKNENEKRKVISDAKSIPIFNKLTTRDYLEINISAVSGLYFQSIGNTFEDW